MNSHFFVTGQIGMKFGQKRHSLSSIEPYLKNSENMPLRGDFVPNRHFLGCFDGSSCHTPRGQGLRFSTYRSLPSIRERANGVPMNRLFVRFAVSAVEAPKVIQISLSEL